MKKLFAVLICSFAMAGYVAAEERAYEIDPVATANAPWEVGKIIVNSVECYPEHLCYRVFLGITTENKFLIQEFYASGNKFTDPIVISSTNEGEQISDGRLIAWYESGKKMSESYYLNGSLAGMETLWYENGQKLMQRSYTNGRVNGLATVWHENGQQAMEGYYQNGVPIGVFKFWDPDGELAQETDYGSLN